jgi:hypothetical protein
MQSHVTGTAMSNAAERYQRHLCVDCEFDYLGKFEVIFENAFVCETWGQGERFDVKNNGKNLARLSL